MSRLRAGWRELDPALSRKFAFNFAALAASTVGLASAYGLGFRYRTVAIDIAAMVAALVVLGTSVLFARRFGARAVMTGLTLSVTTFAVSATWVTPHLGPLTAMLMMIPLFVGFPHLPRNWVRALMVWAVVGSLALAVLAEYRRNVEMGAEWHIGVITLAAALPTATVVMIYLVQDAYRRLQDQADALRRTSARLVKAADSARRGIERDLHDGVQQQLLAMSVTIERARLELRRDAPAEAARVLGELADDNRAVLHDLRELARGIYPPLLAERGIVAAVQAAARRSPVPVKLEAEEFPRPPSDVEAAAYFCILEALTNAARHSDCSEVTVSLRAAPGLEFVVADDGGGFDQSRVELSGLLGLHARMTAAGGTLQLWSAPGRGTVVTGRFAD